MERKNAWKGYDEAKSAKVDALAKDYMDFLDNGKTERECVDTIVNQIEAAGYRELPEFCLLYTSNCCNQRAAAGRIPLWGRAGRNAGVLSTGSVKEPGNLCQNLCI